MKVLYDTSVLIAALLVGHSSHSGAFKALKLSQTRKVHGYLSAHSLAELYSVLTRLPKPLQVSADEAQTLVSDLVQYLEVVPLVAEDYFEAISTMVALKLSGGGIFDALIAQAAVKAEVVRLITLNPKDFIRLGEAIALLVEVPQ
jgi:predicted nucleic acid-binding protein